MSEAMVTATGTIITDPIETPGDNSLHILFGLEWHPSLRGGRESERTNVVVSASGGLAEDVLDKLDVGDRVTVVGRLGTHGGRFRIYANCIALDLRSIGSDEREAVDAA